MATRKVDLETRKLDREYPQPFIREVQYGDTIEFYAVDATFTVTISNDDNFLTKEDGSAASNNLSVTLNSGSSKKWKVADGPLTVPHKVYKVVWDQQDISAVRGDAPPKIIIVPISD